MPIPAVNPTLAQLITRITTEMQLDPGLISDTERTNFLNDCLTDLGAMSCFEKQATLAFTNGIATLPVDFVDFIAIFRDDKAIKPAKTDRSTVGYQIRYPDIEVRPHSTEDLTLWYTYMPAHLTLTTDKPELPFGTTPCLIDYAVAHCHRKNGNIGLYREYMSAYERRKYELFERLTRAQNSRVGMIVNNEDAEEGLLDEEILF